MRARLSQSVLLSLIAGGIVPMAAAQTATMPPHVTTFTGNTRGYYFTAPADFIITGVQVMQAANPGTNPFTNWAIVRFQGNTPPPVFATTTNAFDQLGLGLNRPANAYDPVSITIHAGEVIGVYGNSAAASGTTTGTNSYTATVTQATTTILGNTVNLFRSGMQFHLGSATSPAGMHDVWAEPTSTQISRVQFTYTPLDPNAPGACCAGDGTCANGTYATCQSSGGVFQGANSTCATVTCPQPGACCKPDATCAVMLPAACSAASGVFQGPGSACTTGGCPFGRCCAANGGCSITAATACTGTYGGNGTTCSPACPMPPNAWVEQGDAGALPSSAQGTQGADPLNNIYGTTSANDAQDMFQIRVCDVANFSAAACGSSFDTQLWLFDSSGMGVVANDDTCGLQSTINGSTGCLSAASPGTYYLAISGYDCDPSSAGGLIFDTNTTFTAIVCPTGPGAGQPVSTWGATGGTGTYTIALTGACFGTGAGCYANCDGSTTPPVANVADFTCFLQKFAAGCP